MPYSRQNVSVKVPHKSGFSMRHRNSGTLTCGTITPLLVEEVIPNTGVSCKINLVHQLPPLASDTFMNCKVKVEAFFIPFRLLSRSFEDFFCDFPRDVALFNSATALSPNLRQVNGRMPVFHFADDVPSTYYGPGSLMDYLGCIVDDIQYQEGFDFNPAALEAYHLVWQEFYRNPRVQKPAFAPDLGISNTSGSVKRVCCMPFSYYRSATTDTSGSVLAENVVLDFAESNIVTRSKLIDGVSIFDLRQRNFGFDYFTSARPTAQQGLASSVEVPIPADSDKTYVTIAAIRAANSLQQFRERNGIPTPRMVDQVRARYNANLADGVAQRPIFIGSASYDVVTRGVDQTAENANTSSNPFNSVAAQYGRAYGSGSDFIIDNFVANEPGLILVNQTLVPEVTYSSGIRPYLRRYLSDGSIVEMANPILQNVGDEQIDASTLLGSVGAVGSVFGYADRYGSFMYHPNECHGLLRDGQSLAAFVLQRSFGVAPEISSSFLEIPKTYLDGVFAVESGVSGLSSWYDSVIDLRLSMPLGEFSIPSLQDPAYEHGDTVNLRRNGQVF